MGNEGERERGKKQAVNIGDCDKLRTLIVLTKSPRKNAMKICGGKDISFSLRSKQEFFVR